MSLLTPNEVDLIMNSTLSGETSVLGRDAEFGWWHPRVPKMLKKVDHALAKSATVTAHAAVKAAKVTTLTPLHYSLMAAKWSGKEMEEVAKKIASVAAYPIKMSVRSTIQNTAHALAGPGRPVTSAHRKEASKMTVNRLLASRNPLTKFGGLVLKWVGTGVSGVGAGFNVGMTGGEVAALASASAATIARELAAGMGKDLIKAGMKKSGLPDHVPTEKDMADAAKNKMESAAKNKLASATHIDDTEAALTPPDDSADEPEEETADAKDDDTETADSDAAISGNVYAGLL